MILRFLTFLRSLGSLAIGAAQVVGAVACFAGRGVWCAFTPPFYWRETGRQFMAIGYRSLPVVGLTALFTGAVLALQIYVGGSRLNAESAIAAIVAVGITRELGPVIGGLMVAGRVGAAIAAEIGTMRVTEQIDALDTLSTDPYRYLVAPRLIAATVSMPILIGVADTLGILGGTLVGVERLGFNAAAYLSATVDFLTIEDVISGLVKAVVFGFLIGAMGCYHGFRSDGGAQGVGRATTNSVISSSMLILTANYVLTELFFSTS